MIDAVRPVRPDMEKTFCRRNEQAATDIIMRLQKAVATVTSVDGRQPRSR
jgi:hypothetical protein